MKMSFQDPGSEGFFHRSDGSNPCTPQQDWIDALFDAVHRGDASRVVDLMEQSERDRCFRSKKKRKFVDFKFRTEDWVDVRCSRGATPLMWAAWHNHLDVMEVLLDRGSDPDSRCFVAGGTPLIWAARRGSVEAVKMLCKRGANMWALSKIPKSWRGNCLPILPASHHASALRENAMMVATQYGKVEVVKVLVEHAGSNIEDRNAYGQTALHIAAWCGHIDLVSILVRNGADVNARMEDGSTPIMLAVDAGYHDVAYLLLCLGADPSIEDADGQSAMTLTSRLKAGVLLDAMQLSMDEKLRARLLQWSEKFHCLFPLSVRQQIECIVALSYRKSEGEQNRLEILRIQGLLCNVFTSIMKVWMDGNRAW